MRCVLLHLPPPRIAHPRGAVAASAGWLARLLLVLLLCIVGLLPAPAQAQGVELRELKLARQDGDLVLEFSSRLTLGPAIEDALQRGVPMYFNAQAAVYRNRWYWRDERMARQTRTWRLAYQPLTANWRLSTGGLSQSFASLKDALGPMSGVSGWRLVESDKLEPGERYYMDFSFRLDNSQLPQPMQIDLGGDWKLGVERTLRVD